MNTLKATVILNIMLFILMLFPASAPINKPISLDAVCRQRTIQFR